MPARTHLLAAAFLLGCDDAADSGEAIAGAPSVSLSAPTEPLRSTTGAVTLSASVIHPDQRPIATVQIGAQLASQSSTAGHLWEAALSYSELHAIAAPCTDRPELDCAEVTATVADFGGRSGSDSATVVLDPTPGTRVESLEVALADDAEDHHPADGTTVLVYTVIANADAADQAVTITLSGAGSLKSPADGNLTLRAATTEASDTGAVEHIAWGQIQVQAPSEAGTMTLFLTGDGASTSSSRDFVAAPRFVGLDGTLSVEAGSTRSLLVETSGTLSRCRALSTAGEGTDVTVNGESLLSSWVTLADAPSIAPLSLTWGDSTPDAALLEISCQDVWDQQATLVVQQTAAAAK